MKVANQYIDKETLGVYSIDWLEGDSTVAYDEENLFYWASDINELEPYLINLRRSKARYCLVEANYKRICIHQPKTRTWLSIPHKKVFAIFTPPIKEISFKEPKETAGWYQYNRTWNQVLAKDPKFKAFCEKNRDLMWEDL